MKRKELVWAIGLTMVVVLLNCNSIQAQSYSTAFTTSITYQNIGTGPAEISFDFYDSPTTTTPINITRDPLAQNAGTSVFVGSLDTIPAGFQGSAVLSSNMPIAATLVQVPNSATVKNRPLSNGLNQGAPNALLATVLKNQFGSNSRFSVQNAGSAAADVTIKFYNTSAALIHTMTQNITPGAAFYVDAGQIAELGASFNGSVVVETAGGFIVASVMELSIAGTGASAFEGLPSGSTKVYMPSAICDAFGGQNSAFAVQNTSLTDTTSVTVTYSNGLTETASIGPGSKQSFVACNASGMPAGFSGSAQVESTTSNIVAIGKVYGGGLSTAFLGQSSGGIKLAVPYVRWSESQYDAGTRQKTFIAIQNIGADLAAGAVTVKYLDKNGVQVAVDTLAAMPSGQKLSSWAFKNGDAAAAEFGYYADGTFGGSAIIEGPAGSQLVAVARVQSKVGASTVAEDYNGITAQ